MTTLRSELAQRIEPYIHRRRYQLSSGKPSNWYINGQAFLLNSENAHPGSVNIQK